MLVGMNTTHKPAQRPRTLAAARLPRPAHEWCAVALPMAVVPGCLVVLDGDDTAVAALLERVAHANDNREVLRPAPLAVVRADDAKAQSLSVIQPALRAGTPVFVGGGLPDEAIRAGEPVADLVLTVRTVPSYAVTKPAARGSISVGFTATLTGANGGDHLLHLFDALLQASLAGLPVQRKKR